MPSADLPTSPGSPWGPAIAQHLSYLQVQKRLSARTLAMYGDAFSRLQALCD